MIRNKEKDLMSAQRRINTENVTVSVGMSENQVIKVWGKSTFQESNDWFYPADQGSDTYYVIRFNEGVVVGIEQIGLRKTFQCKDPLNLQMHP